MSKRERAMAICKQALRELTVELSLQEKNQGMIADREQLVRFERYLERILCQLESNRLPPKNTREFGMGRAIVDSWPLDSKLGSLLCSAEQAYRDL